MSKFELFLEMLHEAKKDVAGVYIGRFQGLTVGHAKVIELISQIHNKGYVVLIKGEKTSLDKKRNPFPENVQIKMIKKVLDPKFEVVIFHGSILDEFKTALKAGKIKGKDFVFYAGPDRVQDYRRLGSLLKDEGVSISVVDAEQMVPRSGEISGTKLREALKNDDLEAFKKVSPKEIWSMFKELQSYI